MRSTNLMAVSLLALALAVGSSVPVWAQAGVHGFHGGTVAPRGVPASVTSFGFGGRPGFHGVPASVTSLGFGAHVPFRVAPPNAALRFGAPFPVRKPFVVPRHHRFSGFGSPFFGGYSVAYPYPVYLGDSAGYTDDPRYMDDPAGAVAPGADSQAQRDDDARQQLDNDYRTELNSERRTQPEASASQPEAPAEPVSAQPSTVLVFKDGHQVEVENYAIVGTTLYDLSQGRSKRVELADLDLGATTRENDQRGVEFQLPAGTSLD